MGKHILAYIPAAMLFGLATVGGLQTMGHQLDMAIPYKTWYALFISGFVYLVIVTNEDMVKISLDGMFVKRAVSAVVGLAIIGMLWYADYEYERASVWSALLSSVLYIYMVVFGPNVPPDINPLFLE